MFRYFRISLRHSIILRTLIAFGLVICFDLMSLLLGIYLSDSIRGDAEAINKAGSLRMQAWHLALLVNTQAPASVEIERSVQDFNVTISAPVLVKTLLNNTELLRNYAKVTGIWQQRMLPLIGVGGFPSHLQPNPDGVQAFTAMQKAWLETRKAGFIKETDAFVAGLNIFVKAIEKTSEQKLAYIRWLQIVALAITLLLAIFIVVTTHKKVVIPLQRLIAMVRKSARSHMIGQDTEADELGMLTRTLDGMSQELELLYSGLEQQVELKTAELRQSNAALKLLFDTASRLYKTTDNPVPVFETLLEPIASTLGVGKASICLLQFPAGSKPQACTIFGSLPAARPGQCRQGACRECAVFQESDASSPMLELHSFEILIENRLFGHLHLETPAGVALADWQLQLLTALADLFAAALNLNRLGQEQARVALMEERAVIARELHDSLAQALSYQKIQLVLLKKQLDAGAARAEVSGTIGQLQESLVSAYRQLRELLATFRLKLDKPGLDAGIEASIKEYARHSELQIALDYRLRDCPLTPNEEIHCLQIVREATSNVIKHALAKSCQLSLQQDSEGRVHIRVEDDGIGIREDRGRPGHYGLAILKERTKSLAGSLDIEALSPGTRVRVSFMPESSRLSTFQSQSRSA